MDRRTLFTVQASLLLFLGGVILASYFSQSRERRDKGSQWFATAFFCAGIGLLLQAYRGLIPPFFSIALGNGIFMLFGAFCNRAAARTTGQKRDYMVLLILLNLATVTNYAYYTWWQPDMMMRTMEAVPVLGLMYAATVDLLLRNRDPVIRPATRAMVVIYCIHFAPNVLRVALAWKVKLPDAAFSWFGIITIAGLALSYLWIGSLRSQEELKHTAMTDPLTGLFNRRALDVLALREIEHAKRRNMPCSALMLDIDRFKQINDTLGHAAGDASLSAVAGTLQATLRVTDIATRLGGDEFFILLPDCDEVQSDLIVARLNTAIAALQLSSMGNETFAVAASIGKVTCQGTDLSLDELLHGSDIMLYREKQKQQGEDTSAQSMRSTGASVLRPQLKS